MQIRKEELRKEIIKILAFQGFKINPHVRPSGNGKRTFKRLQQKSRLEQISHHKNFLNENISKVKEYCKNGSEIIPENISLEMREVHPGSIDEIIFRWWNLVWWNMPYQHPYGRQLRFLLWDTAHNAPFGLIALQSPVLKMSVRDKTLAIPKDELDIWVNKSLSAQRVGALPPYNELLGGKMVALALTSNEIRESYKRKYKNYITTIKKRKIKPDLLFLTTTSAFGKSSLYNRLKYRKSIVAKPLGYTQGSGSFHIPDDIYEKIIKFLKRKKINVKRHYGNGPSRKLKLISLGFAHLKLPKFEYHGIKREFYLFPLAFNLRKVISKKKKPIFYNRPFNRLVDYWKERWAIPRAKRILRWKNFKTNVFFSKTKRMLKDL
ncbi:MAG: DUF4338 domain-containing protein [Candidatus Omnitrophica bacterium]|jgi:hypothetical protein|nr:DUF4338 domain-containing protein [Candidatus Omnitrophota bacterium]